MNTAVLDRPTMLDPVTGKRYFSVNGEAREASVVKKESGRGWRYAVSQTAEKREIVLNRLKEAKAPPAFRV